MVLFEDMIRGTIHPKQTFKSLRIPTPMNNTRSRRYTRRNRIRRRTSTSLAYIREFGSTTQLHFFLLATDLHAVAQLSLLMLVSLLLRLRVCPGRPSSPESKRHQPGSEQWPQGRTRSRRDTEASFAAGPDSYVGRGVEEVGLIC